MDFSRALNAMKKGDKLTRSGWNGKGMYVMLARKGGIAMFPNMVPEVQKEIPVAVEPFFVIQSGAGTFNTWVPSVSDLLTTDWELVLE